MSRSTATVAHMTGAVGNHVRRADTSTMRGILHDCNAMNQTTPQDLNLMTHRAAGASVWDRRGWDGTRELAMTRWLLGIGGGALACQRLASPRRHRIVSRGVRGEPRLVGADRPGRCIHGGQMGCRRTRTYRAVGRPGARSLGRLVSGERCPVIYAKGRDRTSFGRSFGSLKWPKIGRRAEKAMIPVRASNLEVALRNSVSVKMGHPCSSPFSASCSSIRRSSFSRETWPGGCLALSCWPSWSRRAWQPPRC